MTSIRRAISFGLALWLIRFIYTAILSMSFGSGPINLSTSSPFGWAKSALNPPVVMALATSVFVYFYLKAAQTGLIREGLLLSIIWLVLNIGLDSLILFGRPGLSGLLTYGLELPYPGGNIPYHFFRANAVAYLLIPLLSVNAAYLLSGEENKLAKGLIYGLAVYLSRFILFFALGFAFVRAGAAPPDPSMGLVPAALFTASTVVVIIAVAVFWFKDAKPDYAKDGYILSVILLGMGWLQVSVGKKWDTVSILIDAFGAVIVIIMGYLFQYLATIRQSQAPIH